MKRRSLLRLAALPLLVAPAAALAAITGFQASPQDTADLGRIQAYLNGVHTLKAHFLQVAPDGAMSQGTVWMDRPGRMRFEYDPPSPFLLVAGGGMLTFEDRSIHQISQVLLTLTPLGILLADHITLGGPVTVVDFHRLPGQLQVKLVRTNSPHDGSLTLLFTDTPLSLRQWTVLDAQRRTTTVTLYDVEQGMDLKPELFHFHYPTAGQFPGGG